MTSARRPLPTDIVALVSFDGRVYPNEAKPLDRLGADSDKPHALEAALEQWFSFATGKHTWVSVRGATIQGLVSARPRSKRSAWEVEVLINTTDDDAITESLLARMLSGIGKQGAERVFLRVATDSPVKEAARAAGFFAYTTETLFRRPALPPPAAVDSPLRAKTKADAMAIYQLYSDAVPANVRAIEGATFREWQAAQEKWGGRSTELLTGGVDSLCGWTRVMADGPSRIAALSTGSYDYLMAAGLQVLGEREVFCLAPQHAPGLTSALVRVGFGPVGDFETLAKRLARTVEELSPESAKKAIPVS
ncbi:MAG: hypothetical protein WD904_11390 [Dehalococcoidia bacterium]